MYKSILCIIILLLFHTTLLFSADITSEWIENNPTPSKQELLSFVSTHYPSMESIQETYNFFYTVLEQYPPSLIHYSIYIHFAKIATLRYDFQTAALLYYSAFEITRLPEHLLMASIQEYQTGNINLAKRNISILQERYNISNIIIPLITLNIAIYIYEKKYSTALEYIHTTIEKNEAILLPASIYYFMYKLALKINNHSSKEYALTILQDKYKTSIEYQLLQNTITTLPIPSHFFSFLDLEINNPLSLSSNEITEDIPLSSAPELGYQVSSFQNKEKANNYYNKLIALLRDAMFDGAYPIMSISTVQNTIFYQIIIPLSQSKDVQSQIKELRNIGIEGFLKYKDN